MTAEVAILNKKAVALAADSAATSESKIFNSHNKLFTLSKHHPVGIMIYQNSAFMGYPWETIIKCFREFIGDTYCTSLERYLGKFLVFLEREKMYFQPGIDK